MTERFSSFSPRFRGRTPWGGQGSPTTFPLPPNSREDLRLDSYLKYPHAGKALYIYKHPCPPVLEPRPNGTAVSVANHYTLGLLATDLAILNTGQVTRTTPELVPSSPKHHTDSRTFEISTGAAVAQWSRYRIMASLCSNPGEGMDICKCIASLRHEGTLNSRRAASLFVWLMEDPLTLTRCSPSKLGWNRAKPYCRLYDGQSYG
ncbi:hypothetical protein TNCV_600291 [Trichonephila clavipes]|nr:hypothetical protein TNCV_600291 [Trichonephila clavipes]